MSDSVHTSRAKFRKAFQFEYTSEEERTRVLGKIIDESQLKSALKANTRLKRKAAKLGVSVTKKHPELKAASWRQAPPSTEAKLLVGRHNQQGYGRSE